MVRNAFCLQVISNEVATDPVVPCRQRLTEIILAVPAGNEAVQPDDKSVSAALT